MFYNKKLFKEAGVAEPPKTLDEFMADAQEDLRACPASTATACAAVQAASTAG